MGTIVAYEIQTYRGGEWKIDSIFDDKELATFDATRMEESGRHSAIRIVEETYDSETDLTKVRIVFRSSKVSESNQATEAKQQPKKAKSPVRPKPTAGDIQRKKTARPPTDREKPIGELKMFWYVIIVGVGLILLLSFITESL